MSSPTLCTDSTNASSSPQTTPHVPFLDGLRGLAIILILILHFGFFHNPTVVFTQWWGKCMAFGWCGVDLFFVLSGFLITGILLDSKGNHGYFRNFYMRRVLRIFPLYYGVLVFLFLLLPLLAPQGEKYRQLADIQGWLWCYAQNWYVVCTGQWVPFWMNHFWSLAVEEQFYLIWPVVVLACNRKTLLGICAALLVAALTLRVVLTISGMSWQVVYASTLCRLDPFAAGGLVALLLRGSLCRTTLARAGIGVTMVSAGSLGVLAWYRGILLVQDPWVQMLGFSLVSCLFAGLLLWGMAAGSQSLVQRVFSFAPLRWLAKYSYALYVLHFPMLHFFLEYIRLDYLPTELRPFGEPYFNLIFTAIASAVSLLIAVVSYHCYEKHFLKLKRFFPQRTAVGNTVPAETEHARRAA